MADPTFSRELRESELWVDEGLVSAEQAVALRSRYAGACEEPRSRAGTAVAVVGAIAAGLGVIGFFAANWEEMSHGLRLTPITGAIAPSYAGAFHLRVRTGSLPMAGGALSRAGGAASTRGPVWRWRSAASSSLCWWEEAAPGTRSSST